MSGGPAESPRDGAPAALAAGRVGRAHGLDGSFYITRPRARLLVEGAAVALGGTATRIVRRAGTDARPIVRVEGVDSREQADALRGAEVLVEAADAPALEEGEFWAHELEGCVVAAASGARLGVVVRMIELPSCEALEVRPDRGGEPLIVPMVKDAILSLAPGEQRIVVDLGFLGLAEGGEPA